MKRANLILFAAVLSLAGLVNTYGQQPGETPETNYRIYTYTLVGSDDAGVRSDVPSRLSKTVDSIRRDFGHSNFGLLSTQFQTINAKGFINYNGLLNGFMIDAGGGQPVHAEWSYAGFRTNGDRAGLKSFQFSMLYPVKTFVGGDKENAAPVINNQRIGLSVQEIGLKIGEPSLIATLPVGVTGKSLYFIVHLEEAR